MRILFVDGTDGFSPTRLTERATGGIIGSLTIIPRYLASKGHEVYVKTKHELPAVIDGVHYVPPAAAIPKWDVSVFNRNLINRDLVSYSKSIGAKVVWWLHDIVDFRYLEDNGFKGCDRIIALSEYCKSTFSGFYDIPEEKFVVIPNGVDSSVFYPGKYEERVRDRYIMASALIKGYLPVETAWTNLKRLRPNAELRIYSSQSLHGLDDTADGKAFLKRMADLGARVWRPVDQATLADIMRASWGLLMPNHYPEICSNLLLQAQACGLPVITSNIGSAPEFIVHGRTGILTEGFPHDLHFWIKKYAEAVVGLSFDDALHRRISESDKKCLTWEHIGEKWDEELKRLVAKG